ncbi:MAG: hypothetical protein AABM42_03045 [Actinomycetota bacterium]
MAIMMDQEALDQFSAELSEGIFGRTRPLRKRAFRRKDGALCFWTTERDDDGMFLSGVYRVTERSPRNGALELDHGTVQGRKLRRAAKDRARNLARK